MKCLLIVPLLAVVAGLGGIAGGCAVIGQRLVLPGKLQGDPRAILMPDPSYEIILLKTKNGTKIVAQLGKALGPGTRELHPQASSAPTVIFFYGIDQTLAAPADQKVFNGLRAMGVNVLIPEFPGYGMSEGKPSEQQCYATADAALDYLLSRSDINHDRIIAAGRSLGTGPAFDLASRRPLAGVIAVGGFTNTADAAMATFHFMPHWFASALTAKCRFDNLAKIKQISCPILLVYSPRDKVVPPWMTDRLAAETAAPIARIVTYSDHNSLWKSERHGLTSSVRDWMLAR